MFVYIFIMCVRISPFPLCSLLLCILTAICHNPLYIACVFMHIVPHKSRLWIVCSTVSCLHVQNTNAMLFQGLYRLQAFAESISLNVCTLIVFFLWANLIWNSTSILCQNTPQRKSGLLGSVYWTKFLSVFQNVTERLDWGGLVHFILSVCALE